MSLGEPRTLLQQRNSKIGGRYTGVEQAQVQVLADIQFLAEISNTQRHEGGANVTLQPISYTTSSGTSGYESPPTAEKQSWAPLALH